MAYYYLGYLMSVYQLLKAFTDAGGGEELLGIWPIYIFFSFALKKSPTSARIDPVTITNAKARRATGKTIKKSD